MGHVCFRQPASGEPVPQVFKVGDLVTSDPVDMVSVKMCARSDTACASSPGMGTSAADGNLTLALPMTTGIGFDGFLEITGAGRAPTLYYPYPPIVEATASRNVYVFSSGAFGFYAGLAGVDLVPTRGHLAIVVSDCAGNGAAGVMFTASTADVDSKVAYTANKLPSANATATDPDGAGGFLNLPVGPVVVTAIRQSDMVVLGQVTAEIRAGWITSTPMVPAP